MIDPTLFTVERILREFLDLRDKPWLEAVSIIPDYMPPYPRPDTKPTCVIRFTFTDPRDGEVGNAFLRYSKGPKQHHFWDMYGDDYISPELALQALMEAPTPPQVMGRHFSVKFKIPQR